jgi:hypothetical protein
MNKNTRADTRQGVGGKPQTGGSLPDRYCENGWPYMRHTLFSQGFWLLLANCLGWVVVCVGIGFLGGSDWL